MIILRKIKMMFETAFPWPAREERRKAIEAARQEKRIAQRNAEHARRLEAQFRRIVEENHFAESIARQIMRRETGGNENHV